MANKQFSVPASVRSTCGQPVKLYIFLYIQCHVAVIYHSIDNFLPLILRTRVK